MDPKLRHTLFYVAAAFSLLAAVIHLWVMPEHNAEWWGYGLFFLLAAGAQVLFALAIVRNPTIPLLRLGIAGNLAIIALWSVTRTIGIPFFGPNAGEVEGIGQIDLASKIIEALLVFLLLLLLRTESPPPQRTTSFSENW
jgi:hypothetical protein